MAITLPSLIFQFLKLSQQLERGGGDNQITENTELIKVD